MRPASGIAWVGWGEVGKCCRLWTWAVDSVISSPADREATGTSCDYARDKNMNASASESPVNLPQGADDELPSAISIEPTEGPPSGILDVTFMSFLAGMFLTICVFLVLGMYCQSQKRKKYNPYEWNNNTFTVPWHFYQINNLRDVQGEKQPLRSSKQTTINMYTSRNKADSKYPKIKRKFPYFVTIPEEDENDQETRKLQIKIFPKSFPHF